MSFIDFQSLTELKKERECEREARKEILHKAKEKYDRQLLHAAEAKRRGEDTWMLPSVNAQIEAPKKKRKKEKHKKKKHKRGSSSNDESDEEITWVEKNIDTTNDIEYPVEKEFKKREEWMEATSLFKTYTREDLQIKDGTHRGLKKLEENRKKVEANKPGSHARELNPYYQDGGLGLPKVLSSNSTNNASPYDAGWLRKALTRAQNQAKEEGRTLEDVAKDRWGSLEAFYKLLGETEAKSLKQPDKSSGSSKVIDNIDGRSESLKYCRRKEKDSSSSPYVETSRINRCPMGISTEKKRLTSQERNINSDRDRTHKVTTTKAFDAVREMQFSPTHDNCTETTLSKSSSLFLKPGDVSPQRFHDTPRQSLSRSRWKKMNKEENKIFDESSKVHCKGAEKDEGSQLSTIKSPSEEDLEKFEINKYKEKDSSLKKEKQLLLTDKEMNQLGAKLTKAELLGNLSLVAKLKKKLEKSRMAREDHGKQLNSKNEPETQIVVLTRTDASGFTRPVTTIKNTETSKRRQKPSKTHDADGHRTSYFPDDHKYDLKAMFEKEKNTSVEEQLAMFVKGANKEKLNDDFDVDDMFMSKIAPKESLQQIEERDRKLALLEHQRNQKTLDNCHSCLGNKLMKKHLIVSLGSKCYVSVPYHESLTEGHCLIIPIHHVPCSTRADEDLWEEVMSYRQSLVRMFSARNEDCIFLEMATGLHNFPHMVIQCIPLEREVGELAPIYFKKAIDECDEEWAQNKKLVDLKGRSVRKAVPKGLPYFWVDFGLSPGYAHVIENEQKFKKNFGLEIIGGMIDAEVSLFRKPKPENFETQRKKVLQFAEMFKEFDPST